MTDDHLDQLLTPPAMMDDAAARQRLLEATLLQLPRRWRWVRSLLNVMMFGVGLAAGWLLKPPAEPLYIRQVIEVPAAVIAVPTATETETVSPPPSVAEKADFQLTAADLDKLETAAEIADAPTAAKLYRRVADEYLARSDVSSAVRCYRLHLNEAGREGLVRTPDDSWLLVSLKSSTLEEENR
jgi:hypothetical protein